MLWTDSSKIKRELSDFIKLFEKHPKALKRLIKAIDFSPQTGKLQLDLNLLHQNFHHTNKENQISNKVSLDFAKHKRHAQLAKITKV